MSARLRLALAAFVASMAMSGVAAADPAEAARAFDEGLGHYRRKAFSDAADAFFRAYRLKPSADAAFNAGLAWQLAGRSALSATAYEVALAHKLDANAAADARARLSKLAADLGRIEVSAPEGSRVRVSPFVLGANHAVFYLDPGQSEVSVTLRDGSERVRHVVAIAGQTTVVLVEEVAPKVAEPPAAPVTREPARTTSPLQTAGWISLGVAAVATGAAIYLGVSALSARDDYDASKHRDPEARLRAQRLKNQTNVAWAIAGITAAGGVGLVVFAPPQSSSGASAAFRGVSVSGRF